MSPAPATRARSTVMSRAYRLRRERSDGSCAGFLALSAARDPGEQAVRRGIWVEPMGGDLGDQGVGRAGLEWTAQPAGQALVHDRPDLRLRTGEPRDRHGL